MGDHPFVPRDLHIPDYFPISLSQYEILSVFGVASLVVFSLTWLGSGCFPKITKTDRFLICWWAFTGLVHTFLEGYFAFSPEFYKDKSSFYFAEVWKEYSKGDSRYVARNSSVVTVEGITAALEGPASLLAVYSIAAAKPYSHILQFSVCVGQLYGCLVYFITAFLEGDDFAASRFYYWAYYVVANSFWVVIPTLIAIRSWKKICSAFEAQNKSKTP